MQGKNYKGFAYFVDRPAKYRREPLQLFSHISAQTIAHILISEPRCYSFVLTKHRLMCDKH